jgi:hypothetical protein
MEAGYVMNYFVNISRALGASALVALLAGCGGGSNPLSLAPSGGVSTLSHGRQCSTGHKPCLARVLLISLDGMHGIDLQNFVATHPNSTLAALSKSGVTYTNAHAPVPTDSYPGLLALVTGGHPASTGVYYEDSFDRTLYPPHSNCTGPVGTEVALDESIDLNANAIDGGGGINPPALTQQLVKGVCTQVYPHNFLRVNDIFEIVKAHGGLTAWSDKEQSYEMLNGPSGTGVDELYNREINAGGTTSSLELTEAYDDGKVAALINEIDGKSPTGTPGVGVPALFGMNFQAVSVGQKLAADPTSGLPGGYIDATGTPGTLLEGALEHTDASLGKFVAELQKQGLADSTLIIISAKHGQAPINRTLRRAVSDAIYGTALASNLGNGRYQTDDLALIWLQDRSPANEDSALNNLRAIATTAAFENGTLYTPGHYPPGFGDFSDPRIPDFAVKVDLGAIYTGGTKIAEHGGFSDDDSHVALLVSYPQLKSATITDEVQTAQVAPTLLEALGINGRELQAVRQEYTDDLPGLSF